LSGWSVPPPREGLAARRGPAYLAGMSMFPRPARPEALLADVRRMWHASTRRYKLVFGALAITMTSLIITGFVLESRWGIAPEGPQIVYASDWHADRSDSEIQAQQKIDQRAAHAAKEERRRQWQKLDGDLKKLGL
jgi:hypothetical protein